MREKVKENGCSKRRRSRLMTLLCACTMAVTVPASVTVSPVFAQENETASALKQNEDFSSQIADSEEMSSLAEDSVSSTEPDDPQDSDSTEDSSSEEPSSEESSTENSEDKSTEDSTEDSSQDSSDISDDSEEPEPVPFPDPANANWLSSRGNKKELYRLYNPNSGEHFYTLSSTERTALVKAGWKDENRAWVTPESEGQPVYRLYNPNASDHHYTLDRKERDYLIQAGWKDEGISFRTESEYGQSVYRLYNPNAKSGSHHYTLSSKERDALVKAGWKDEGTAFYAISDYAFFKDSKNSLVGAVDAKNHPLSGRMQIHDDWYEFDSHGALKTGWIEVDGQNVRYSNPDGRQALGTSKIDNVWYRFDPSTGNMLENQYVKDEAGREFVFDANGHALSGRVFVYPRCGNANGQGNIEWKNYGWTDNPARHQLLSRKKELEAIRTAAEADGTWMENTTDPAIQDAMAELHIVDNSLDHQNGVGVHSIYNPNSGEHFYTADEKEIRSLCSAGWKDEGVRFLQPRQSDTPVYRLYSPSRGEHHFTSDRNECEALAKYGWINEGISFYSATISRLPVMRLYNPNAKVGSHHYTGDQREKAKLVEYGWKEEKGGWNALNLYSFVQDENGSTYAYDPDDQQLFGLVSIHGERYYFDPSSNGRMVTGERTVSVDGQNHEYLFGSDGKMVYGEVKKANGYAFYDVNDGHRLRNSFVQYGSPTKVCWYDENGLRACGKKTIQGHVCVFDDQTGALKPNLDDLKAQVGQTIASSPAANAQIGFAVRIPGKSDALILNSRAQQSASVMKVFVMGAIHEDYDRYAAFAGRDSLERQLSLMISISDNESWKSLVAILGNGSYSAGLRVLKDWCVSKGYNDTQMTGIPKGNYTSAADASKILCDIQEGRLKHSAKMKALLQTQAHPGRMLANLPSEARTANKPGWIDFCENDTVLVDAPFGTYVVTMLCDGLPSSTAGKNLMARISPLVYNWMKENLNTGSSIPEWAR